jgi:hypothetical protein
MMVQLMRPVVMVGVATLVRAAPSMSDRIPLKQRRQWIESGPLLHVEAVTSPT